MAQQAPPELLGIHTNMPGAVPSDVSKAIQSGGPAPSGLSDEERRQYEKLKDFFAKGVAWALEMGTRPQTLYGIADSPIGLAAWLIDHGDGDAEPAAAITAAPRRPSPNEGTLGAGLGGLPLEPAERENGPAECPAEKKDARWPSVKRPGPAIALRQKLEIEALAQFKKRACKD